MGARADRTNRVVLVLLALLLLAAGTAGLLLGSGLLGDDLPQRTVLPDGTASFVASSDAWLWPAAVAVAALLAVLALRWLLLQLRTDRVSAFDLTADRAVGETRVEAGAVTDALVDAVESVPGVRSASARLVRVRSREQLLLHVQLADRSDVAQVRGALAEGPLAALRTVLGEACPPVRVALEPTSRGSSRALA